ncbi:hypothetical protein PLCT2_01142 [Planctomycetaceae bacterium]|nr:hypothetical protein PLCT2_01142 [Planctomycetaceae bacterium]
MRGFWTMLLAAGFTIGMGGVSVFADSAPEKPKEEPKKEEPKVEALGLPWTADEIKAAVKVGATMLFKNEQTMGEKTTSSYTKLEITAVTEEGYTMKTSNLDAEKKELGKAKEKTEKWTEYMSKMKFTKADTTVSEESIETPAGKFDCKVYTQKQSRGGQEMTLKFYFLKDKAGTLAKLTGEGGGFKMTQVLEEWKAGGDTK